MRMFGVSKNLHNSIARSKRFKCGSNGSVIFTLPMGEPIALSRNPFRSSSDFSSVTCRSVRSRTLVLRMERNSMCRTPHWRSTSICSWGSGEISSAKALSVNISTRSGLCLTGLPKDVIAAVVVVDTRQDEEKIREAIEIDNDVRIDRFAVGQGHDFALGP